MKIYGFSQSEKVIDKTMYLFLAFYALGWIS